ncbi:hypothetical protein BX070DRAFT_412 [Coemansia spiralis]|nr:hypothetical protein BX070DRAFT_412 [Coemansia spiralis]
MRRKRKRAIGFLLDRMGWEKQPSGQDSAYAAAKGYFAVINMAGGMEAGEDWEMDLGEGRAAGGSGMKHKTKEKAKLAFGQHRLTLPRSLCWTAPPPAAVFQAALSATSACLLLRKCMGFACHPFQMQKSTSHMPPASSISSSLPPRETIFHRAAEKLRSALSDGFGGLGRRRTGEGTFDIHGRLAVCSVCSACRMPAAQHPSPALPT